MADQILEFSSVGVITALVPSFIEDPSLPMGASTRMDGCPSFVAGGRYVKLYPPLPCQLLSLFQSIPDPVLASALSAASSLLAGRLSSASGSIPSRIPTVLSPKRALGSSALISSTCLILPPPPIGPGCPTSLAISCVGLSALKVFTVSLGVKSSGTSSKASSLKASTSLAESAASALSMAWLRFKSSDSPGYLSTGDSPRRSSDTGASASGDASQPVALAPCLAKYLVTSGSRSSGEASQPRDFSPCLAKYLVTSGSCQSRIGASASGDLAARLSANLSCTCSSVGNLGEGGLSVSSLISNTGSSILGDSGDGCLPPSSASPARLAAACSGRDLSTKALPYSSVPTLAPNSSSFSLTLAFCSSVLRENIPRTFSFCSSLSPLR